MLNKRRLQVLAALLAIVACMLMAQPYEGLRHDGILYLGQALLNSRVPGLSQDTFFAGGSQDSYSIYAHVMVPLYEHLGMPITHVAVILASWLLMMGAMLALLQRFDHADVLPLWGLLAFAVASRLYGGIAIIGYGEPFVTARTFAEPALLWSLVALLNGRHRITAALLALAALLHPLMTLPVMAAAWCFMALADRRWLWLLAAVPLALLAAWLGIPPWHGLLKIYDPYWWSMVESSNPMVMLASWTLGEKLRVVLDMSVLLVVSRLRTADAWTRLIHAVVGTTALFVGLTALGTDLLHSVLLTQLQLWRAHWIAHALAMAVSPWLVLRLYRLGGLWPISAFALALALLNAHVGQDNGVATLALWALVSLAAWRVDQASRTVLWLACGCLALCMLGLSAAHLHQHLREMHWVYPSTFGLDAFSKVASYPTMAMCGFAALMFIGRRGRSGAVASVGLSATLLGMAAISWDQRPDLARAVETQPITAWHPFATHLPSDATVYWPHQLAPVWSMLERTSHFAAQQGAGLLFNRDTALIFGPRKEIYRRIRTEREQCRAGALLAQNLAARHQCEMPTLERLAAVCGERETPDFLVLPGLLAAHPLATWQPPAHRDPPQTYALYRCSMLHPPTP